MPYPLQQRERRQQVRGMLWLAALLAVASAARASMHHIFNAGWWRLW